MASIAFDIQQIYNDVFGKPYVVNQPGQTTPLGSPYTGITSNPNLTLSSVTGSIVKTSWLGKTIWLPVTLRGLPTDQFTNGQWFLPYVTVRLSAAANWIETDMWEQRGTVKELFSLGDYDIKIKGFFIDEEQRLFPDQDLSNLQSLYENGESFYIDNALTNAFLADSDQAIIKNFEVLETSGGRVHVKGFSMDLKSDSVFVLTKTT